MARIELDRIGKRFGAAAAAVDKLSLDIDDHAFVTLLGPSGCGKTTTLRMLAGFIRPDTGRIVIDGQVLSSPDGVVPPERRGMGMVFQNYAIWPHKTVFENVVFGLRVRKVARSEATSRVARSLEMVNLTGLEDRYPNQLSGGQQQRVALARSLVVEPSILLLDEPLSNLDAKLRERMRWELKSLQRRTGITFVYVTHDQAEAMALSDRIAVMHLGELQQYGPPREVYTRPANRTVADFMGLVNLVPGQVVAAATDGRGLGQVDFGHDRRLRAPLPSDLAAGDDVQIVIRPENVALDRVESSRGEGAIHGTVDEATFLGNMHDYYVDVDGIRLRVQSHPSEIFVVGQPVLVRPDGAHCTVFAR